MSLIEKEQIGENTGEYALWVYQKGDSTLNKIAFNGNVTTYTDTTHFESTDLTSTKLDGVEDGYFIGWYIYCVRDSGGAGAAPQGEYALISGYTSSTGAFTHIAFTTPLAVGDSVIAMQQGILNDMVREGSTVAVTSAETDLYIDDAPSKIINGLSIKIDSSAMVTGDAYDFREYYRIKSGGTYGVASSIISLSGAQLCPIHTIYIQPYRYGMKMTAQKVSGTDRSFDVETIYEI